MWVFHYAKCLVYSKYLMLFQVIVSLAEEDDLEGVVNAHMINDIIIT